jgi:hypothetical protein
MTSTPSSGLRCSVTGEEKLPPEVGGGQAICSAISAAVIPALQRAGIASSAIAISVKVKSDSRISAVASVNEHPLPEQHVASSDRPLNGRAVDMLARAVAAAVSGQAQ